MATPDTTPQPSEPTPAQAHEVLSAGAEAAAAAPNPAEARTAARRAVKKTAQRVHFELSDEDVNRIVTGLVQEFDARGAFDAPPPAAAPPASAPAQPAGEPSTQASAEPPRPRTFADRFLGTR